MLGAEVFRRVIDELTREKTNRTHTNLITKLALENIDEESAEKLLSDALEQNIVKSYRYDNEICYKIINTPAIVIQDHDHDVITQMAEGTQTETDNA